MLKKLIAQLSISFGSECPPLSQRLFTLAGKDSGNLAAALATAVNIAEPYGQEHLLPPLVEPRWHRLQISEVLDNQADPLRHLADAYGELTRDIDHADCVAQQLALSLSALQKGAKLRVYHGAEQPARNYEQSVKLLFLSRFADMKLADSSFEEVGEAQSRIYNVVNYLFELVISVDRTIAVFHAGKAGIIDIHALRMSLNMDCWEDPIAKQSDHEVYAALNYLKLSLDTVETMGVDPAYLKLLLSSVLHRLTTQLNTLITERLAQADAGKLAQDYSICEAYSYLVRHKLGSALNQAESAMDSLSYEDYVKARLDPYQIEDIFKASLSLVWPVYLSQIKESFSGLDQRALQVFGKEISGMREALSTADKVFDINPGKMAQIGSEVECHKVLWRGLPALINPNDLPLEYYLADGQIPEGAEFQAVVAHVEWADTSPVPEYLRFTSRPVYQAATDKLLSKMPEVDYYRNRSALPQITIEKVFTMNGKLVGVASWREPMSTNRLILVPGELLHSGGDAKIRGMEGQTYHAVPVFYENLALSRNCWTLSVKMGRELFSRASVYQRKHEELQSVIDRCAQYKQPYASIITINPIDNNSTELTLLILGQTCEVVVPCVVPQGKLKLQVAVSELSIKDTDGYLTLHIGKIDVDNVKSQRNFYHEPVERAKERSAELKAMLKLAKRGRI